MMTQSEGWLCEGQSLLKGQADMYVAIGGSSERATQDGAD